MLAKLLTCTTWRAFDWSLFWAWCRSSREWSPALGTLQQPIKWAMVHQMVHYIVRSMAFMKAFSGLVLNVTIPSRALLSKLLSMISLSNAELGLKNGPQPMFHHGHLFLELPIHSILLSPDTHSNFTLAEAQNMMNIGCWTDERRSNWSGHVFLKLRYTQLIHHLITTHIIHFLRLKTWT